MAQLKIDELNTIESAPSKRKTIPISEYFEPMELTDAEKEERVDLANKIYIILSTVLTLIQADYIANGLIDKEYYSEYIYSRLQSVVDSSVGKENYQSDRLEKFATNFIDATDNNHKSNGDYWISDDRAIVNAEDESNAIRNFKQLEDAKASGYKFKTWVTMNDKRVRHTHQEVSGEKIGIEDAFEVGNSEMLFPMDSSLGASMKEIANCRCSLRFSDKFLNKAKVNDRKFHTKDDPMREVTGAGFESNKEEIEKIIKDLQDSGIEIVYSDAMEYQPSISGGADGCRFIIDKDASYSAWLHEYKHFTDDREDGYLGFRVFQDNEKCMQREIDAYQIEIDMAKSYNRDDIVERLEKLRDNEIQKYRDALK